MAYGCGVCPNCKKAKSLEWSIRARHELITEPRAVFITLTYRKDTLHRGANVAENRYDKRGVLCQKDMQDFFKRLRKAIPGRKIRYLYCGEYGEEKWRPHYHALLYGLDYLEAPEIDLDSIWTHGKVHVSEDFVTDNAIQYVIGYIKKKIPGRMQAYAKYQGNNRPPPYLRASQGLGGKWSDIHRDEWTKTLQVSYRNAQYPIPRYYIRRVKAEEGIKIRFNVKHKKIGGDFDERFEYKVIENPDGYYTKRINAKAKELQENSIKEWSAKYRVPAEELREIALTYRNLMEQREYENRAKWQLTENYSMEELQDFFSYEKEPRNEQEPKGGTEPLMVIEREVTDKLKSIAKRKEYEYKNGIYGKRDVLETMEDILYGEDY